VALREKDGKPVSDDRLDSILQRGNKMIKRTEHRGSFTAVDEEGHEHTIHIYVDVVDAATMGDPNAEIEGLKSLKTEDGGNVNRLEKGKYQIVQTGQILTSGDPAAP